MSDPEGLAMPRRKAEDKVGLPEQPSIIIPPTPSASTLGLLDIDFDNSHSSTASSPTVASGSPLAQKMRISPPSGMRSPPETPTSTQQPMLSIGTLPIHPPEMLSIHQLISTMKLTLTAFGGAFDNLGQQIGSISTAVPNIEAASQLKLLKAAFGEQVSQRQKHLCELQAQFETALPEMLHEYQEKVKSMVSEFARCEVPKLVKVQLEAQIPQNLRQEVYSHRRQFLEVKTNLHNSEARRYNGSIRSALTVPLRPLLRPLPSPEQSPAFVRSPRYTPATPGPTVPLPTPVTALTRGSSVLNYPTASPLFPQDLQSLLRLDASSAQKLLEDYGLVDDESESDFTPTQAEHNLSLTGEADERLRSREADLSRFMAHIGVSARMVPTPKTCSGINSKRNGRPSLSIVITSPTGL